jgi:hypothetical protein
MQSFTCIKFREGGMYCEAEKEKQVSLEGEVLRFLIPSEASNPKVFEGRVGDSIARQGKLLSPHPPFWKRLRIERAGRE